MKEKSKINTDSKEIRLIYADSPTHEDADLGDE